MIRGLLERAWADGVAPALQALVQRRGEPVLEHCIGRLANGRPVDAGTAFDLASLTKVLLTSSAFVQMWVEGLDAPENELLPGVSVQAALEHRAGFPAHRPFHRALGQLRPGSRAAERRILELTRQAAESSRTGGGGDWAQAPSTVYSDLGFMLVGARIEQRSGRSLEDWAHHEGLLAFDRRDGPRRPPSRLAPAGPKVGDVHDDNARAMGGVAGHAGLFGSARAVAAAVERGRLGFEDQPEWRRAWTPGSSRFSMGWDHPEPGGSAPGWPRRAVGHLGFTGTSVWIDPVTGLTAVLLTNRVLGRPGLSRIRRLRRAFHAAVWARWGSN